MWSMILILFSNLTSSLIEMNSSAGASSFSVETLPEASMLTVSFFFRAFFKSMEEDSFFTWLSEENALATNAYSSSDSFALGSEDIPLPLLCRYSTIVESPTLNSRATLLNLTAILRLQNLLFSLSAMAGYPIRIPLSGCSVRRGWSRFRGPCGFPVPVRSIRAHFWRYRNRRVSVPR